MEWTTIKRHIAGAGVTAGLGLLAAACGGMYVYPLPISGDVAHGYFAPLAACAGQQGFQVAQHPTSVNVRVEPSIWVQFMVQGAAYNMVVVVSGDVPEPERPARAGAAKAKGDALFACAKQAGPSSAAAAPPHAPGVAPAAPGKPTPPGRPRRVTMRPPTVPAGVCGASKRACKSISDCMTPTGEPQHCTAGGCYPSSPRCPCDGPTQCGLEGHCAEGRCWPNKPGTPCSGASAGDCGLENHCTNNLCWPSKTGSECTQPTDCGLTSSSVDGVCN